MRNEVKCQHTLKLRHINEGFMALSVKLLFVTCRVLTLTFVCDNGRRARAKKILYWHCKFHNSNIQMKGKVLWILEENFVACRSSIFKLVKHQVFCMQRKKLNEWKFTIIILNGFTILSNRRHLWVFIWLVFFWLCVGLHDVHIDWRQFLS